MRKVIGEGAIIPTGYMVAWYRYQDGWAVCYPWGIHLIVGWVRWLYLKLRYWRVPPDWMFLEIHRMVGEQVDRGWAKWYAQGFHDAQVALKPPIGGEAGRTLADPAPAVTTR